MNRNELITIYRLKEKGKAPTEISNLTGLTASTIRSQFKRHPFFKETRRCFYCGKPMVVSLKNATKKFCSKKCKQRYWDHHHKQPNRKSTIKKVCPHCGEEFLCYGVKKQIYCSRKCYLEERFGSHE